MPHICTITEVASSNLCSASSIGCALGAPNPAQQA
jgi:hypothetical protein